MKKTNSLLKIIITLFLILSFIKFFTAQISFSNDVTTNIVTTYKPQISSNYHIINEEYYSSSWFGENGFMVLHADEMGNIIEAIHSALLKLWWIMLIPSITIILSLVYKLNKDTPCKDDNTNHP